MRVIGPASLGIVNTNPAVSLNASMAPSLARRGGLGLFSQSAAIGVSLYAASSRRRVGISTFLSAGNRADVSGNDMMQFWEDDADTTAVGPLPRIDRQPAQVLPAGPAARPDQAGDRGQVRRHGPEPAARPRRAHHAGAARGPGRHDAPGRRDPGGDHRRADGRRPDRLQPAAAARGRASPCSATPARWARWWRTAPPRQGSVWSASSPTSTWTPGCPGRCRPCGAACRRR